VTMKYRDPGLLLLMMLICQSAEEKGYIQGSLTLLHGDTIVPTISKARAVKVVNCRRRSKSPTLVWFRTAFLIVWVMQVMNSTFVLNCAALVGLL
jgi:hypothetical protein